MPDPAELIFLAADIAPRLETHGDLLAPLTDPGQRRERCPGRRARR